MADSDPSLSQSAAPNAPMPLGQKPISRGRMALLFIVMLTTAAGNTAMQSVMPSIGTELEVDDVWISLAYTWSALLWVIFAPIWARRSDKRGRKSMMALGMMGFILSFGLGGLILVLGLGGMLSATATLLLFAAARSFYGTFGSAAPPAVQAYVASRTPRAERTKALALVASSFGLGTVIGPAIAPLLVFPVLGLSGPFWAFALAGVVVLITLRLRLPNDDPTFAARGQVLTAPFTANSNASFAGEGAVADGDAPDRSASDPDPEDDTPRLSWLDKRLRPWLIAGVVGGHAQAALISLSGFFILDRLGLRDDPSAGTGSVGLVLMCGALATLVAQWGLIPALSLGPRTSTLWGMILALLGTIFIASAYDLHTIALGFAVASLGFGLYRPGFTAGASLAVSRAEQGQVSGIVASLNGSAYIVGPAGGVWLYGHHETIGFATIAGLCLLVIALGWKALESDAVLEGRKDAD